MAEDLTDYMMEHDIRVRYLHSDVNTVERVEIIRDLRLGKFDALVGINLLREGLDLPEVSLVAILDADKEGFLRSERSLIQSVGRCARNINGMAILYADKITGSMQRAMDTTDLRRQKQRAFNNEHDITPRGIKKNVTDILEAGYDKVSGFKQEKAAAVAEDGVEYSAMPPSRLAKELAKLETDMYEHAQNLEFEKAAMLRDRIELIKQEAIGLGN